MTENFLPPTLIILAGGASSRMWPIHEKSMLRFGTEPLLIAQLRRYEQFGFDEAIVVANPDTHAGIAAAIPTFERLRVRVTMQLEPRGMGDAILCAAPFLGGGQQAIYITQVHDVVDDTLHEDMLLAYRMASQNSYLAGVEMQDYFPGGYLVVNEDGRITGIVEKPGAENRPSNLVNIVAHIHANAPALFKALKAEYDSANQTDDHYERAIDRIMQTQVYRVVRYRGGWAALKFPWHVLDVMQVFLSRISGQQIASSAFVAPTASVVGNVFIGENAKIFPGAAVVGPAYVGANTVVGNNALVRGSMVLDRCEVGFTTEIARSYVAEGVAMHACRVLDSVLMPGVNFSAGCTTANLRIDHGDVGSRVKGNKLSSGRNKFGAVIGEKAFIGVDVMTMPGVKIGARAEVGPGTHVHQDIPDDMRVYVKQTVVMTEKTKGE
ncbi:MAG: NTP transferase domain-containing protein [Anaerolineae bacterium]|nr:NTP transferase domain-containing protein [Anaerolineae bacterium]